MENSLRNHALVRQQNQQQQRNREEYYRNNGNGIIRNGNGNNSGNSNSNSNSTRSRTSGSCSGSGKGSSKNSGGGGGGGTTTNGSSSISRSRSTRSSGNGCDASDEAVHLAQHKYHNHQQQQEQQHQQQHHHQQQEQQQHHQQQQQRHHEHQHQYHHHQQQQQQQQYYQQQQQQQQQSYPQQHQYYSNNHNGNRIPQHQQQQQQQQYYQQQQQQQTDQYGYPINNNSNSNSNNRGGNSYGGGGGSHLGQSHQSGGNYSYILDHQLQFGGAETTADSQSHYSIMLGSVGGGDDSGSTTNNSNSVRRSVHGNGNGSESEQLLMQLQKQTEFSNNLSHNNNHYNINNMMMNNNNNNNNNKRMIIPPNTAAPARIGFKSNSCFKSFPEALKEAIRERDKEQEQQVSSRMIMSGSSSCNNSSSNGSGSYSKSNGSGSKSSSNGNKSIAAKDNVIRKMTLNLKDLYIIWHTEHSKARYQQQQHNNRRKNNGSSRPSSQTSNGNGNGSRPSSRTSIKSEQQQRSSSSQSRDRDGDVSPHHRAFAQMSLGGGDSSGHNSHGHGHSRNNNNINHNNSSGLGGVGNMNNSGHSHHSHGHHNSNNHNLNHNHNSLLLSSSSKHKHGSLSAVIESASQNSSTTQSTITKKHNKTTRGTGYGQVGRGSSLERYSKGGDGYGSSGSLRSEDDNSSIATRSSMGTRNNSLRSFGAFPPQGKCLTQHTVSEGASNDNLCDNAEGNLIVYENDNISVPRPQVHVLTKGKIPKGAPYSDFRVQSLLGQGTFAQVFRCLHAQTGQLVAVKIVKNKPAYTRQAAIEIDVIRALTTENDNDSNNNEDNEASLPSSLKSDYMVDMVCYFMYKDHLCLVFELLGLNLYEVLKKRQFRGLPLTLTQTLVRQAVLGARGLAQKSIVHCDIKPENILLVDEDDAESVMSAGDSKRMLSSSLLSNATSSSLEKKQAGHEPPITTASAPNNNNNNDNKQQQTAAGEAIPASKSPMDSTIATNNETHETHSHPECVQKIKLIDFGSACFEGQISHTYIQSRFYRSPEVLLGLAYDSAIDMWSLGCVAAELFLGLPILPGVHEHDQLGRISEMIGDTPDWMLEQGTKSSKYFVKYVPAPTPPIRSSSATPEGRSSRSSSTEGGSNGRSGSEAPRPLPQWRIKTRHEYIASLSQSDVQKKGGLAKLEKQPGNRYFKRKALSDIVLHKGQNGKQEDLRLLKSFIHFLYGILDPDPWKRWTAFQVASHPFLTGAIMEENVDRLAIKDENHANTLFNLYWEAPFDPTIYRRKLLNVQKTREKQQAARRGSNRGHGHNRSRSQSPSSQDGLPTIRNVFSNNSNPADDTHSVSSHTDEVINHAAARQMQQGSYQGPFNMSSSMTQVGGNQGIRLVGYNSAYPGTQSLLSGPLSFSEAGNSVVLPGSYNDFAHALHRPGVVPMGDSVTTATTSSTSMSSNSRSTYNQGINLVSQIGSYGSHQVMNYGNQQRRFTAGSVPGTSRSFDLAATTSTAIPTVIDSHHQQALYASSQSSGMDMGPPMELEAQIDIGVGPPMELIGESIPTRPTSATSTKSAAVLAPGTIPAPTVDAATIPLNNPSAVTTNNVQQTNQNIVGVYDNPGAQAYQQQLVAMQQQFQQQQLLLQQQQAALALQQEQLRVYAAGMNAQQFGLANSTPATAMNAQQQQFGLAGAPATAVNAQQQQFGLANSTPAPVQAVGLNAQQQQQQFGLANSTAAPVQGGGYYVVPAADGTQRIVASNHQGMAIPISGQQQQVPGIAPPPMPGQIPALPAAQMQGIAPAAARGLPSVGIAPAIPGMHAGGIIPPPGSVPGMAPATDRHDQFARDE